MSETEPEVEKHDLSTKDGYVGAMLEFAQPNVYLTLWHAKCLCNYLQCNLIAFVHCDTGPDGLHYELWNNDYRATRTIIGTSMNNHWNAIIWKSNQHFQIFLDRHFNKNQQQNPYQHWIPDPIYSTINDPILQYTNTPLYLYANDPKYSYSNHRPRVELTSTADLQSASLSHTTEFATQLPTQTNVFNINNNNSNTNVNTNINTNINENINENINHPHNTQPLSGSRQFGGYARTASSASLSAFNPSSSVIQQSAPPRMTQEHKQDYKQEYKQAYKQQQEQSGYGGMFLMYFCACFVLCFVIMFLNVFLIVFLIQDMVVCIKQEQE